MIGEAEFLIEHAAYVWCMPYNSTYARKPRQSFLSLKILRRFFQTTIMAEEFPSFDLSFDFSNDQNKEEAGKFLTKFTSAYLFQIAREKSCDYLLRWLKTVSNTFQDLEFDVSL